MLFFEPFFFPLERPDGNESSRNAIHLHLVTASASVLHLKDPTQAYVRLCSWRASHSPRVALMAKCYNRPSVSRLSASSFPERRRKRVLPLLPRDDVFLPAIASVNVTLCGAIALRPATRARTRSDRIVQRSAACELVRHFARVSTTR